MESSDDPEIEYAIIFYTIYNADKATIQKILSNIFDNTFPDMKRQYVKFYDIIFKKQIEFGIRTSRSVATPSVSSPQATKTLKLTAGGDTFEFKFENENLYYKYKGNDMKNIVYESNDGQKKELIRIIGQGLGELAEKIKELPPTQNKFKDILQLAQSTYSTQYILIIISFYTSMPGAFTKLLQNDTSKPIFKDYYEKIIRLILGGSLQDSYTQNYVMENIDKASKKLR